MNYDSAVDDVRVALLAVWKLAEAGRWDLLAEVGVEGPLPLPACRRPPSLHAEGADAALTAFVALAPAALAAALEMLRRYRGE